MKIYGKHLIIDMLYRGQNSAYRLENWPPQVYQNLKVSMRAMGLDDMVPDWIDEPSDSDYEDRVRRRHAALAYDADEQRGEQPAVAGMSRSLSKAIDDLGGMF